MSPRILDVAQDEAREAARWYEERQAGLGQDFLDELGRALQTIETRPGHFCQLQLPRSRREVRRCLMPRFPYAVVYEVRTDEILVDRHG
jgi:hypothetical protein